MKRTLIIRTAGAVMLALAALTAHSQVATKVLRMVPGSDLKILDPVWTTAFVTRDHGYMVYDTLFGIDAKGEIQRQMVGSYTVTPGSKVWTFTLRPQLAFHDDQPVTSADVIQSIKRWGQRDSLGQKMLSAMDKIEEIDAKTFKITFKEPFPMLLEALSKPSSIPLFIMPKRVAETPADKQIDDATGSGPYIFKKDEYRPGAKVVYVKNTKYVPRPEAPSGTAGGKYVYVDRVEWVILKDAQTQANALANGEVDMLQFVPAEQYAALKANPNIELVLPVPKYSLALHLNHLVPPFNDFRIAQAALMTVNQEALLRAQLINKELYSTCTSIYSCGTAYASNKTSYFTGIPQFEASKKLLKEAGYDGKPVVLMHPADFSAMNKLAPVMAQLLRQGGFNVDMQTMDWPTLLARRAKKDPSDKGGWNLFITGWGASDTMNPLFFAPMTGNGEKGWFGWSTDARLEELKSEFLTSLKKDERKELAQAIQLRVFESGLYAPLGEYEQFSAIRKGVTGLVKSPVTVYWNIQKK